MNFTGNLRIGNRLSLLQTLMPVRPSQAPSQIVQITHAPLSTVKAWLYCELAVLRSRITAFTSSTDSQITTTSRDLLKPIHDQ
jgi:hypothetical protein